MPTPTPTTTPPATTPSHKFFDWMRGLGITREPGWIGGVCAGVAARLGIDPIIVRGIAVVVAILGGPALLLYAAAWLLLPDQENRIHLERLFRGEFDGAIAGIGVLFLVSLLPLSQGFWFAGPWFWDGPYRGASVFRVLWTLAIIASVVWLIVWLATRPRTTDSPVRGGSSALAATPDASSGPIGDPAGDAPPPPPAVPPKDPEELAAWKVQQADWKREHAAWKARQADSAHTRLAEERRIRNEQHAEHRRAWAEQQRRTRSNPLFSAVAIGIALIAGAATALTVGAGEWTSTATITGLAVTLGVLGLAIVINGFAGRRSGGASGLAVLVAIVLIFSSLFGWVRGPVVINRDTAWAPTYSDGDTLRRTVISGDAELDLTGYFAGTSSSSGHDNGRVYLTVVSGNADVTAPADEFTEVQGQAVSGSVTFDGVPQRTRSGSVVRLGESFEPLDGSTPNRDVYVEIWVISGDLTVSQAAK